MNQRIKKFRDRKAQDTSNVSINTGGHVVQHSAGRDPVVRTPQKATGNLPDRGFAKASPLFKKIDEVVPLSKEEEKKAIAESTEKKKAPEAKNKSSESLKTNEDKVEPQ